MSPMVFPVVAQRIDYASAFHAGHPGVDIFAQSGSPVVAIADGLAYSATEAKGGNVIYLKEPDGTQYFYGHLSGHEGDYPRQVSAGEVLGYVGTSGSAVGTPAHVHFEVRPKGGERIDPVAVLEAVPIRASALEFLELSERAPISAVHAAPKRNQRSMSVIPLLVIGALYLWDESSRKKEAVYL